MSHNVKSTWKLINEVTGTIHDNKDKVVEIKLNNSIINIEFSGRWFKCINNFFTNLEKHLVEKLFGILTLI